MNPLHRIIAWVAPMLALIAIGFALLQARRASEATAMLAAARSDYDLLESRLRRASLRFRETEGVDVEETKAGVATAAANATAQRAPSLPPGAARPLRALIASNPRLRELSLQGTQRLTDYGPKVWLLQMSPEQIAKMKAYNYEIESASLDLAALAEQQGLAMNHPDIQKMEGTLSAEMRERMRALLGPENAERYYAFAPEYRFQVLVDQVAGALYLTGTPVTLAQEQQWARLLREHVGTSTNDAQASDAWVARAVQAALPSAQIAALRTVLLRKQYDQRAQELIDAATARHPAASGATLNLPNPALPRRL